MFRFFILALLLENLAVRQELAAFKARTRRPHFSGCDRAFWVALRNLWFNWREALVIVKPDTVARWHRAGLRR